MIETEAKIKITKEKFNELSNFFKNPKFINQENIFYKISGGFLRIRKENEKRIITLKKPSPGKFNSRKEIEFSTKDKTSDLQEFFKELNFEESISYKKRRANLRWNDCVISLDILLNNRHFIEIEGEPDKISEIINELNLQDHPQETKSYLEILNGLH